MELRDEGEAELLDLYRVLGRIEAGCRLQELALISLRAFKQGFEKPKPQLRVVK